MAKKRKAAARKSSRRPARAKAQGSDENATLFAVIVLVLLVLVGTYFYMQNKQKAALLDLTPVAVELV